jgi:hypothetical protein
MDDAADKIIVLGLSNLEPPQPRVAILEKILELGPKDSKWTTPQTPS